MRGRGQPGHQSFHIVPQWPRADGATGIRGSSIQPGELIFTERPILHTAHPYARSVDVSDAIDLATDWQRLLALYAYLKRTGSANGGYPSADLLDFAMRELSTEGVTSPQAREADPEREEAYRGAARQWVRRYKDARKKKSAAKRKKAAGTGTDGRGSAPPEWTPSVEEIERLVGILETNSHARDEDDQQDLHDPRADLPLASQASQAGGDDEDEEEADEACGLWLVASMANHSCVPNCTAHIPSARALAGAPPLHLRCIRPIKPGDTLTLSYHDEELAPGGDRRALLARRGFACQCALCTGEIRDYARAAACPRCDAGVCCPAADDDGAEVWRCDRCVSVLTPRERAAVVAAEDAWMAQWPAIIDMVSSPAAPEPTFAPFVLLRAAASASAPVPSGAPLAFPPALSARRLGLAPLHLAHGHVLSFFKWALFGQSAWLRAALGGAGVAGALLAMAAGLERLRPGDIASEERRALGYWLVREADARIKTAGEGGAAEKERWEIVRHVGWKWWKDGMGVIYGRPVE